MADMATAINGLSMQFDPTPFLTEWQRYQASMNPALNPQQPPYKAPQELSWHDTFAAQQQPQGGGTPPPQPQEQKKAAGFSPQEMAALMSMMPKPQQWPPAPGVAPRGPNQVQLQPYAPAAGRTPIIPGFAAMLGR